MRSRRRLLPGAVLVGFAPLFDAAWGNPCPPHQIPTVAPSCIGGVALPFPCPHCGAVRPEMADGRRTAYRDPQRGFSWCPACRGRYRLEAGAPLPVPLAPGAQAAPCRVTVGGVCWIIDIQNQADDLDLLDP